MFKLSCLVRQLISAKACALQNTAEESKTFFLNNTKCEAIPLQAWTGPEGSKRLRFPDFKTVGTLSL
jgi:hypothetical protein